MFLCRSRDRARVAVKRALEEWPDIEPLARQAFAGALGRGPLDARLGEVAGEPLQLGGDVVGLAGQRTLTEERASGGDRLGRRLG